MAQTLAALRLPEQVLLFVSLMKGEGKRAHSIASTRKTKTSLTYQYS
jgi:hypothetical protein